MKNKKLRLIIIGILVVFLLRILIVVYQFFDLYGFHLFGNTNHQVVYESKNGSYSMRFPGGWHEEEIISPLISNPNLKTTFSTVGLRTFIFVQKYNDTQLSMEELLINEKNKLSELDSLEFLNNSSKTIGSYSGILLETVDFRQSLWKVYLNHCYDWIIPENGGYTFTFCADNAKWKYAEPIFMDMIQSITLKDS